MRRRFLPQTLPGWALLIVISGLLASQAATLLIVSRDRRAANDVAELYRLNESVFSTVKLLSTAATAQERDELVAALDGTKSAYSLSDAPAVDSPIAADDSLAELEDIMTSRLARYGVTEARVRRDPAMPEQARPTSAPHDNPSGEVERDLRRLGGKLARSEHFTASVRLSDGRWLNFVAPVTPLGSLASPDSLSLYAGIALLISAMAVWAINRLTAPYRLMEQAVHRIGADLKSPPVSENGSREYRAAAHAVNTMQARLRDYVDDREQLTAALAHDLRTPLTRMRLRLATMKNSPQRAALTNDVDELESIVTSVVDFSTMEVTEEEIERVDVASLVHALADDRDAVRFHGAPARSFICSARPVALRRCIANLIDNAVKYGKQADVTLDKAENGMQLRIIDQGPGIPEDQMEAVFRPFVRVEKSRNRGSGGTGLGLTIANSIARSIGGEIKLANGSKGGLVTQLNLPFAV